MPDPCSDNLRKSFTPSLKAEIPSIPGCHLSRIAPKITWSKMPTPMEFVAVQDTFGESGKVPDLIAKYGLDTVNVIEATKKVLARK